MGDARDKRKNAAALLHVGLFIAVIILNIMIAYLKISAAAVFFAAISIALIAAFYMMSYKYYFSLSLFLASEILSLLIFRSAESAFTIAAVFLVSYEIVYLYGKKYERMRILIATSAFLLLFAGVYYMLHIVLSGGVKSFGDIAGKLRADIDAVVEDVKTLYLSYFTYEPGDALQTEIDMGNLKKSLTLFIPGFIILCANLISFVITAVMRIFFDLFYKITSYKRFFIDKIKWRLHLSLVSTLLIPLTLILNMFSGADSNIVFISVVDNINFMLMPAVFVIGVYFIKDYAVSNFYTGRTKIITMSIVAVIVFTFFPTGIYFTFIVAGLIKETRYYLNVIEEKIKSRIDKDDDDEY